MYTLAEHELAKQDQLSGKIIEEYRKVLAELARKDFPDDVVEERKQVLRHLENGLADPALSSLCVTYHIKNLIAAALCYLQEH